MADDIAPDPLGFMPSPPMGRGPQPFPKITSQGDLSVLPPGSRWIDPTDKVRQKPWMPKDVREFGHVPEGDPFYDPQGQIRYKPKYSGVGPVTQTLYDMAATDKERYNVLSKFYGEGSVKRDPFGEMYVESAEGLLKPGRGVSKAVGFVGAAAAPTIGSVAGEIGGAALGNLPGAVAGGAGGAVAGQAFNDMILGLAGVYDRSVGREAGELGLAGGAGGVGTSVGRAVSAVAPAIKAAVTKSGIGLPSFVSNLLGAQRVPEAVEQAARLTKETDLKTGLPLDIIPRPSNIYPEAPYFRDVVEVFYPRFYGKRVFEDPARAHYEQRAGKILTELGVDPALREPLTTATKPVPLERAGEIAMRTARDEVARTDAKLAAARDAALYTTQTTRHGEAAARESTLSILQAAETESRKAAERAIDVGIADVRNDVGTALKAVGADKNPSALWRAAGDKLDSIHSGIQANLRTRYASAYAAASETGVRLDTVFPELQSLVSSRPREMERYWPSLVQTLDEMVMQNRVTLEKLHGARTLARSATSPMTPYADVAEGVKRNLAGMINRALHSPQQSLQVQAGVKIIDAADAYAERNLSKYDAEMVNLLVKKMRTGPRGDRFVGDANKLADIVFKPDATAERETVRRLLGPDLWKAVHAADVDKMVATSKLGEGLDAVAFAKQVSNRVREAVWSPNDISAKSTRLAQQILASEGQIPLKYLPGDTVATLLQRAMDYKAEAAAVAKTNPLGTLAEETKVIEHQYSREAGEMAAARAKDPLGFLAHTEKGIEAATTILRDPDLSLAAVARFGAASPEATALRQVAAWRLLQRSLGATTRLHRTLEEVIPGSVQQIWFPGTTRDELVQLARDMPFILGSGASGAGMSIAAEARVLNPTASLADPTGLFRHAKVPGVDWLARQMLGLYYKTVTQLSSGPLLRLAVAGLKGPPASRYAARDAIRRAMKIGGAVGAGVGTALEESGGGEAAPTPRYKTGAR